MHLLQHVFAVAHEAVGAVFGRDGRNVGLLRVIAAGRCAAHAEPYTRALWRVAVRWRVTSMLWTGFGQGQGMQALGGGPHGVCPAYRALSVSVAAAAHDGDCRCSTGRPLTCWRRQAWLPAALWKSTPCCRRSPGTKPGHYSSYELQSTIRAGTTCCASQSSKRRKPRRRSTAVWSPTLASKPAAASACDVFRAVCRWPRTALSTRRFELRWYGYGCDAIVCVFPGVCPQSLCSSRAVTRARQIDTVRFMRAPACFSRLGGTHCALRPLACRE